MGILYASGQQVKRIKVFYRILLHQCEDFVILDKSPVEDRTVESDLVRASSDACNDCVDCSIKVVILCKEW
jgi:hypothetical protein